MPKLSSNVQAWLQALPAERQAPAQLLVETIEKNIPKGFELCIQNGMLAWVVPLKTYPAGYHCTPNTPLPFFNLASQKNALTLYHMGLYADASLLTWFEKTWPLHTTQKLDMGKSCIRLKKINEIPYTLIGELMKRLSPKQWIVLYSHAFLKPAK